MNGILLAEMLGRPWLKGQDADTNVCLLFCLNRGRGSELDSNVWFCVALIDQMAGPMIPYCVTVAESSRL